MNALSIFRYEGADVRTITRDGEPWFVVADVCRVLGVGKANDAARGLDDDERGTETIRTPSGEQTMLVCSEPGMYSLILRSRKPEARAFKRWVTHEVIPAIRKTGAYSVLPALTDDQIVAQALQITAARVDALTAQVEDLTPRAEAWDDLADADGDYSVADAASILRRAGIDTGPQRLFEKLGEMRWIYRGEGRRWRPYARALDAGYLCERAMPPRTDHDGILVPVPPQVRVTARGLERLRVRLGVLSAVATA
jgi:anti-repressor protein